LALGAAPLLGVVAIRWRRPLVMALPFLVVLNGVTIPFGGVSLHLDQIAACLLLAPLAASALSGTRPIRTDAVTWWLAALLAANVAASAVNSPVPSYSLLQCANLASVWIIYLPLINLLVTREELESCLHCWVWAGIIGSAIGIAAYLLALLDLPLGGAEVSQNAVEHLTNAYGAYGTLLEPNIFGSFTAAQLVLALALLAVTGPRVDANPHRPSARLLRTLAVLSAVGLLVSFTRAAWVGAIAALGLLLIVGRRAARLRIRTSRVVLGAGLAIAGGILLWFLPGSAGTLLRFKIANFVNIGSQTAALRLFDYLMALQQTADHPWLGYGTFTFAPLTLQGADFQRFENWQHLWIGNFLIQGLHDTGVVGLALWTGLLVAIFRRSISAIQRLRVVDPSSAGRLLGLTLSMVAIVIPFLATTGFSLGYSWLIIGLAGAYARLPHAAPSPALQPEPRAAPALTPPLTDAIG
jgi:O-antigen ligase